MKYLLDTNVLKEIGKTIPHENVRSWLDSVDDSEIAVSVISIREIWKGIEKKRATDSALSERLEAIANDIVTAFDRRILTIDQSIAMRWGIFLGVSDKHRDDTGLAATAYEHSLILVTRNIADFASRNIAILDPFKNPARRYPS